MDHYLADLNDEQASAVVSSIEDPLFIYAGAGSGKTRTLICRIAHILENGVPPESILTMTFTRKASDEIRERLKSFVGPRAANVATFTFHQLCLSILKENKFIMNFGDKDFSIADNSEQRKVIKQAVTEYLKNTNIIKNKNAGNAIRQMTTKLIHFVNKAKSLGKKPDEFQDEYNFVYGFYDNYLKKRKMIDFTDFLTLTKDLLLKYQRKAYDYNKKYQYILIDEFQDTSDLNFEILKLIIHQSMSNLPPNRRITIVGDQNQSIYSFRGANPNNISEFLKLFPDARKISLDKNYRSSGNILKAAQSLIKLNDNQIVNLTSTNSDGMPVKIIIANDCYSEAEGICNEIEKLVAFPNSFQYRDIVLMFRMRKVTAEVEMEMFRRGIPYTHKRGISFYLRDEIRYIIAYSRLILSLEKDEPDPNQLLLSSIELVLNIPNRHIRPNTIIQLQNIISAYGNQALSLLTCIKMLINGKFTKEYGQKSIPNATVKKLQDFYALLERMHRQIFVINPNMATNTIIEMVVEMSDILQEDNSNEEDTKEGDIDQFNEAITEIINDKKDTIRLLLEEAKKFHVRLLHQGNNTQINSFINLRKFIDTITLESTHGFSKNAVTLSTIHQMKGLEAPVCFLIRFNQGILPMVNNENSEIEILDSNYSLEEERRIAYVAMTRAKSRLFLTCSLSGRGQSYEPSQFISEIDSKYLFRDISLSEEEKKEIEAAISNISDDSDFSFNG